MIMLSTEKLTIAQPDRFLKPVGFVYLINRIKAV